MAERLKRKPEDQENLDDYLMYLRHLAAYNFALSNFGNVSQVIDLGCGTGYGTQLMTEVGQLVVGLDRAEYALPKLNTANRPSFCAADLRYLPFHDLSFDLAISFQVIEHIKDMHSYLAEAYRILNPHGILILSTPNRNLRLLPLERPWNPYHVKEYSPTQLKHLLRKFFPYVNIFGLKALPEIELIERKRIHTAKKWYYKRRILDIAQKLPCGVTSMSIVRRFKQKLLATEHNIPEAFEKNDKSSEEAYKLESFWVSDRYISKCMDLVAVCQK